jgi:hypothetical protein
VRLVECAYHPGQKPDTDSHPEHWSLVFEKAELKWPPSQIYDADEMRKLSLNNGRFKTFNTSPFNAASVRKQQHYNVKRVCRLQKHLLVVLDLHFKIQKVLPHFRIKHPDFIDGPMMSVAEDA